MKIHAFRVIDPGTISLDAVLAYLEQLPLEQRLKGVGDSPLRVEQAVRAGTFWLVDFAGIKHEGPGKASAATPIEDFELTEEEGFGHETALCFDTRSKFMTLQYNHYGPRISRIQTYLYLFARTLAEDPNNPNEGFGFTPVLKADAAERLNHMGIVKNIEISFYVPGVRAQPNGNGRQSLNSFLDNPLVGSAERVRLQLSAGRARPSSIAVNQVKSIISDLYQITAIVTR